MKILIVTSCGARKRSEPSPAWKLYKSPRIAVVYNRRCNHVMCILSTKYGLIEADRVIAPYEEILTEEKAQELIPEIAKKIDSYDCVIYFRGGAGREYLDCVKEACKTARKKLISFGYKYMGEIGILPHLLRLIEDDRLQEIIHIKSVEVFEN